MQYCKDKIYLGLAMDEYFVNASNGPSTSNSHYNGISDSKCGVYYNLSVEESETYGYSSVQACFITVVLPLVLFFGLLGNALFIYVALRIPHMRTITNRYLVSLSIADIVFLASAIGYRIWKYAFSPLKDDDTPLGRFGCVWVYFLSDVAYYASLIFVTLVSADRYVAVCRPQDRHSFIKGKSIEIIGLCWLISGILAATLTPGNVEQIVYCMTWPNLEAYEKWPTIIRFCSPLKHFTWIAGFSNGLQIIPFFITLVVNVVFYVAIIRGLNQCIHRMSEHGVKKSKDTGMRNQIAKMLVVNGVVFFCLLAPFELYSFFVMIATFRIQDYVPQYLIRNEFVRLCILLLCQLLSYINSAVNPIIYTVMCRRYRQAFREACLPASCMAGELKQGTPPESCRTGQSQLDTIPLAKDTNV